jgi:hypothetical protein
MAKGVSRLMMASTGAWRHQELITLEHEID